MNIRMHKELVEAYGIDKMKKHGLRVDKDALDGWRKYIDVDLQPLTSKQVKMLRDIIAPYAAIRGTGVLLKDIDTWLVAISGKATKARTVRTFESLVTLHLRNAPLHWVYAKDEERQVWVAYYVTKVEYHAESRRGDWTDPEHVLMDLVYVEFGGSHGEAIRFDHGDCVGYTAAEALAKKGYITETPEMKAEYDRRRKLFHDYSDKVGKQFLAVGVGTDDCDGNEGRGGNQSTWYWRHINTIVLDKGGEPSHVVVDLFQESDKSEREDKVDLNKGWWENNSKTGDDEEAEDFDGELTAGADGEPVIIPDPEVPLHPNLACFDLKRHKRLRIDVGQLTPYVYDRELDSKLILPQEERDLVELLVAHKGGFQDIISGKSGGSIILCAGIPGTGKTLTAEVYAEVMERPLYSVQASQLGTSPNELEGELLKVFARASRWGAILLLDEADVYVTKRGQDLQQNAIVGVFLRVLEYYKGVMFLTTNRADLVDDAIASRCLARIDYQAPGIALQKRIWRVLADTAGIELSDAVIDNTATRYPDLTGRDVKNLLKLAKLVSDSRGGGISGQTIDFVKRFKPTNDAEK